MPTEAEIIVSAKLGDLSNVQNIVAIGSDASGTTATDAFGWNAAHHAAAKSHAQVLEFLFSANKSLFISKDVEGCTPANRACREGALEAVKVIESRSN
jgi:hypothetical protein